jgi:hypothetical protein
MRLRKIFCLAILLIETLGPAHTGAQACQPTLAGQAHGWQLSDPRQRELNNQFISKLNEEAERAPARKRREGQRIAPAASSTALRPSRDEQVNDAYRDALSIVATDNTCSRFFGGPYAASRVLTELAMQLRRTRLNSGVGIRMFGRETTVISSVHSLQYRLFERAEVNLAGPFSTHQRFTAEAHIDNVGSFPPDTREARALMLLHEIGHLITGPDGTWLLPDDGHDEARSNANTLLIETKCGAQIRALHER